jgi:energy-converting hydrogenase Eha subunit A
VAVVVVILAVVIIVAATAVVVVVVNKFLISRRKEPKTQDYGRGAMLPTPLNPAYVDAPVSNRTQVV